jgi:23S rRNA pseudouridine1911/1915/1917 synthase
MTVTIHLEDPDFLIVEKPVGIPTQPLRVGANPVFAPGTRANTRFAPTLAHHVAERFPEIKAVGGADWGAVHRLDRETSGLIVFARNQETYDALREAFSKSEVEKEYVALVEGAVEKPGKITWPIGPDPKSAKRVKVYRNLAEARRMKAQEAVTTLTPIPSPTSMWERGAVGGVRILIKTGRRHQIRAHLAAIGHPIVGDNLYGAPRTGRTPGSPLRLHLHASRLKFRHPRTNRWVEASSPAPFFEAPRSIP